jgi:hypothetical protein
MFGNSANATTRMPTRRKRETEMRKLLLGIAAAAALLCAALLPSTRAEALPIGAASSVQSAVQDIAPVQNVWGYWVNPCSTCGYGAGYGWGYGWGGWGWGAGYGYGGCGYGYGGCGYGAGYGWGGCGYGCGTGCGVRRCYRVRRCCY